MNILEDGSIEGHRFTKNENCPYPSPMRGKETYVEYRERVQKLVQEHGFHLGDLSWDDYNLFCLGSGQYEGFYSEHEKIK